MKLIEIDKITAARKIFHDATLLFFEKRNPISIHHLAHAAHEVLCTITGDSRMLDLVAQTADAKKLFKRAFSTTKNFIKHADRDPNASLAFNTETNILILFDCAWIIALYIDKECVYSKTLIIWCAFVYPDLFIPERLQSISSYLDASFNPQDFDAIASDLKSHYNDR